MALIKGFSRPSISKNMATEIRSGRKPASSGGMAFSMAKKAKAQGYADGGVVETDEEKLQRLKNMDGVVREQDVNPPTNNSQSLLDRIFKKKMSMGGVVDDQDDDEVMDDYPEDFEEMRQNDIGDDELDGPPLVVSSNEDDERRKQMLQGIFVKRALRRR